ncbi:MAG: ATP-binding cassette domain-containing protein [Hyphomicrobiales bacterium]
MIEVKLTDLQLFAESKFINLKIGTQENWQFVGASGCGKTSLLSVIASLYRPFSGRVEVEAKKIALVFQEPRLIPHLSAYENLMILPHVNQIDFSQRVDEYLKIVGLAEQMLRPTFSLSGGEKQRVNILRALLAEPDLLLLDEIGASLDQHNWNIIEMLIEEYVLENRCTLVQVSHQKSRLIAGSEIYEL